MDANKYSAKSRFSRNAIARIWRLGGPFGTIKPVYFSNSAQGIDVGGSMPPNAYGLGITQTALQSIGMSTKSPYGPPSRFPEYALAVSVIFTKATNQRIILGTEPRHVLSTSILWNSLVHDNRFKQIALNNIAPGDIIIQSGWHQGGGFTGIVVDHGRIVSNSSKGVRNNASLVEIQRDRQPLAIFRYNGVQKFANSALPNAGFNSNELRIPAGQAGGGQWTTGKGGEADKNGQLATAPSTTVLSSRNSRLSDEVGDTGTGQAAVSPNETQSTATGEGTIDHLKLALRQLEEGYKKEVDDINQMRGISDAERNAGLQSLKQKYEKARDDFNKRIARIDQTAQDIAFAYGGKASDYFKDLDDTDPKVKELMNDLDQLETNGFKDIFLLGLRHAQGGESPPSSDPHVLRSALFAGMGVLGEGEVGEVAEKSAFESAVGKAKKAAQLLKNVESGAKRALKTAKELAAENPGKVVQRERTLRDAEGNKVVDPVTGEGRRVDHVVIDRDAKNAKTYETTGDNVNKRLQIDKEKRIRREGGNFVRDKETGKLTPTDGVSEVRRQK